MNTHTTVANTYAVSEAQRSIANTHAVSGVQRSAANTYAVSEARHDAANTYTMVSDIHRNLLGGEERTNSGRQLVSMILTLSIAE